MGLLALTLRWLDWKAAAAIALAALLFNLFVMPRIGRGIYRDPSRKRDTGIIAYAAMVFLLILLFRDRYLPIAAAVWAMMAFGDPAATIAGRLLRGPLLSWNREKTWAGLLANWAVGGAGAVLVFRFVAARRLEPVAVAILVCGAALYAFLESVRSGLDDHLVAALPRSEEHTSELQSRRELVCRLLLEKKKKTNNRPSNLQKTPKHNTPQI